MDISTSEPIKTEKKKSKSSKLKKKTPDLNEEIIEVDNISSTENNFKIQESFKLDDIPHDIEKIEYEETLNDNFVDLTENEDIEYDNSFVYSIEELHKYFDLASKELEFISKKKLSNYDLKKDDFIQISNNMTKIGKFFTQINSNFYEFTKKEMGPVLKEKEKKAKKPKKKNNENSAVNIHKSAYPEVLNFMELESDTKISNTNVQQAINDFIKKEKSDPNSLIYVNGDNKRFNLIGKLKILFDFYETKIKERGNFESFKKRLQEREEKLVKKGMLKLLKVDDDNNTNIDKLPTTLSYMDLMDYIKYSFEEK